MGLSSINRRGPGLLGLLVCLTIASLLFLGDPMTPTGALPPDPNNTPPPLFVGWAKPDLALVVSGEMHGYLQPCGCSNPQKGGLARRYNFLQTLKAKNWPLVALDLGDIPQAPGAIHGNMTMLKYVTAMKALQLMNYSAVGLGQRELLMPLQDALPEFSLNQEKPRPLALNLAETEKKDQELYELNVRQYEVVNGKIKIGVLGVIGQEVADEIDKNPPRGIRFAKEGNLVAQALAKMTKDKIDFGVVLYQGSEKKALAFAEFCHKVTTAGKLPPIRLILCLGEEAPPGVPAQSPNAPETQVVMIGHKGIHVGVVGFFKNKAQGFDVKYQLVTIGPEYQTKPGQEKANPVQQLMEQYALEVKAKDYLSKSTRGQHAIQVQFPGSAYVGSDKCAGCHKHAYEVWEKSGHAHAYDTLVEKAKLPSNREFDPECIKCHTVGYEYKTGFYDTKDDKRNLLLRDVGCESCHGPASLHVKDTKNKDIRRAMNPFAKHWKPANMTEEAWEKERFNLMDYKSPRSCQKCHDPENDVHWGDFNFIKQKWLKIEHADPKKGKNAIIVVPANGRRPSGGIDAPDEKAFRKE